MRIHFNTHAQLHIYTQNAHIESTMVSPRSIHIILENISVSFSNIPSPFYALPFPFSSTLFIEIICPTKFLN